MMIKPNCNVIKLCFEFEFLAIKITTIILND